MFGRFSSNPAATQQSSACSRKSTLKQTTAQWLHSTATIRCSALSQRRRVNARSPLTKGLFMICRRAVGWQASRRRSVLRERTRPHCATSSSVSTLTWRCGSTATAVRSRARRRACVGRSTASRQWSRNGRVTCQSRCRRAGSWAEVNELSFSTFSSGF